MQTIINTAQANFNLGGITKRSVSNNCRLHLLLQSSLLQGETICSPDCRKWQVDIVQKTNNKVVFSLSGRKNKSFYFETDTSFEYKLIFTADKNSTLRLYNIPDNISLRCDFDRVRE